MEQQYQQQLHPHHISPSPYNAWEQAQAGAAAQAQQEQFQRLMQVREVAR